VVWQFSGLVNIKSILLAIYATTYVTIRTKILPSSHNYKYLEYGNIQLNISQENKEVVAYLSSLIYSYSLF